ncbi:MAG TPA: YdeI/OmpD-associated family protein [Methyloceanibacter sp.]|nr:YdeI/OmpD-associated family protein [Methyloceanibacter sp.]
MSEALSAKEIPGGVVHDLPADLEMALTSDAKALETWEDITPLARNEWICWIESAKKAKTRMRRIEWGCSSLRDGKRRPCCWSGCPHR